MGRVRRKTAVHAPIASCAVLLCLCALLGLSAAVVEIIADPPVKFLDDEKKSKYIIGIDRDGDAVEPPALPGMRTIVMADKTGKKYSCLLPAHDQTAAANATATAGQAQAGSKQQQQQTPSELLSELATLCFYRAEDWWTYEVCFEKHVRQFHREQAPDGSTKVAVEYSLGEYNATTTDTNLVQVDTSPGQKDLKYVSQVYDGGDACDITGGRRQTEVRYSCGEGAKDLIVSIKEPSTCHYVMNVRTPKLCRHPKFLEAAVPVAKILCSAIPAQLDAAQQDQAAAEGGSTTAGAAQASVHAEALESEGESAALRDGAASAAEEEIRSAMDSSAVLDEVPADVSGSEDAAEAFVAEQQQQAAEQQGAAEAAGGADANASNGAAGMGDVANAGAANALTEEPPLDEL